MPVLAATGPVRRAGIGTRDSKLGVRPVVSIGDTCCIHRVSKPKQEWDPCGDENSFSQIKDRGV
jgi:hypothetical protein